MKVEKSWSSYVSLLLRAAALVAAAPAAAAPAVAAPPLIAVAVGAASIAAAPDPQLLLTRQLLPLWLVFVKFSRPKKNLSGHFDGFRLSIFQNDIEIDGYRTVST